MFVFPVTLLLYDNKKHEIDLLLCILKYYYLYIKKNILFKQIIDAGYLFGDK